MDSNLFKQLNTIIPNEIVYVIHEFLYWDITTMKYIVYKSQKKKDVNTQIKNAMSRSNGFNNQEEYDTEHEHWIFEIFDEIKLQALSCQYCGEYIITHTPMKKECVCTN